MMSQLEESQSAGDSRTTPALSEAKHSSCRYFQLGSTCLFSDVYKKRPGWLQVCSLIIWNKASTPTHL